MTVERKSLGARGERLAEKHLKKKGFRSVARNLKRRAGEIDLLMWDGGDLVIVEVRTVRNSKFADPASRVPVSKRRQLLRIARHLIAELADPLPPIRFDVCIVSLEPRLAIEHIEDAFRPDQLSGARV